MHTHYDKLKVARDAPAEVITAAYRSLAKKYHPDKNGNGSEFTRFLQELNESYEVLSDQDKRTKHDEWIKARESEQKEVKKRHGSQSSTETPPSSFASTRTTPPAPTERSLQASAATEPRTVVWALGFAIFSLFFPPVAIAAIICGHYARKQIAQSDGVLKGGGYAMAALILGYMALGYSVIWFKALASD